MSEDLERGLVELHRLMDRERTEHLWFLRKDYYPRSREEGLRILDALLKSADLDTFQRAQRIREWLSPTSSAESAGS